MLNFLKIDDKYIFHLLLEFTLLACCSSKRPLEILQSSVHEQEKTVIPALMT